MPEVRSIMEYIFDPVSAPTPVFEEPGRAAVQFRIGHELEVGSVVLMEVLLSYEDSYKKDEGAADLQFGIRERWRENHLVLTCLDFSLISPRRFVPKTQRYIIESLVARSITTLVQHSRPPYLTMETYHRDVPEPGMVKYRNISTVLKGLGYKGNDFRETNGIHFWFFERTSAV
jgi:hypothetical protein